MDPKPIAVPEEKAADEEVIALPKKAPRLYDLSKIYGHRFKVELDPAFWDRYGDDKLPVGESSVLWLMIVGRRGVIRMAETPGYLNMHLHGEHTRTFKKAMRFWFVDRLSCKIHREDGESQVCFPIDFAEPMLSMIKPYSANQSVSGLIMPKFKHFGPAVEAAVAFEEQSDLPDSGDAEGPGEPSEAPQED